MKIEGIAMHTHAAICEGRIFMGVQQVM
jgi:hypothetical protein